MTDDSRNILADLEALLNANETEKYKKFLAVLDKYGYLHGHYIQSTDEFDTIHNYLIDLLVPNQGNSPLIDLSEFDRFQSFMKDLRQLIETLIIQHCIQVEKLNIANIAITKLENQTENLKDDIKDLKHLIYETEFKKLAFAISTPLKNALSKCFRTEDIRMDPLDESLTDGLLTNSRPSRISKQKFSIIKRIYEDIADNIGIEYEHVIEIIRYRQLCNEKQHELLDSYMCKCQRCNRKPEYPTLIKELNLYGLMKFKEPQMHILEKFFNFYVTRDEYH